MAEFLILKKDSWATTKPESWSQDKFDRRQRTGDVIEAQENGFYRIEHLGTGTHGWDRNTFAVIRASKINLAKARAAITKGDFLTRKFRYSVPIASLAWNKNTVTISGVEVEEWYMDINKISDSGLTDKAAT